VKTAGWISIFILAVGVGFFGHKVWKKAFKRSHTVQVTPVLENQSFVIVIPSYNNKKWCEKNLRSALDQAYDHFRIIFIDDASNDGMTEIAQKIARESEKIIYVCNKENQGAMANVYAAVHSCRDDEIVVLLDGDDWLAHEGVLSRLNQVYADTSVWITYGSYLDYPSYKRGDCSKPLPPSWVKQKRLRKEPMLTSHLKSFRAALFKKVPLGDFVLKGDFFDTSSDLAFMTAMIEMAGLQHSRYVKDVLYIYNRSNPLNDDKIRFASQQAVSAHIRSMKPYAELKTLERDRGGLTDLVIFSFDRPMQLYGLLESVEKRVKGVGEIRIVYRVSSSDFEEGYNLVRERFPRAVFFRQGENPKEDFKPLLLKAVFESSSPYVVFAVDDIVMTDEVDLAVCTQALAETGAYGFYLRLGQNIDHCYMLSKYSGVPPSIHLNEGICAWQFSSGEDDWNYPHTVDFTVYKKSTIEPRLRNLVYHNPNKLEAAWAAKADFSKMGLCFERSKMVNIPLNLVNISDNRYMQGYSAEDLMKKFRAGLKIDIDELYQIQNNAPHIDHEIVFVDR